MEKNSKPNKFIKKGRKFPPRKFKCELCERLIIRPKDITTRKNYTHGKKSKPQITKYHRIDGDCLVELRRNEKKI